MIRTMSCRVAFLLAAALFSPPAAAGETAAAWPGFAGMAEELEAEKLELRDELISAHLSYLAALDKALDEVAAMPGDSRAFPLAWSRAEYLLEASFRLLENTGEYEAFLETTERLKNAGAPLPGSTDIRPDADDVFDRTDGLAFSDARGGVLIPTPLNGELTLVRAGTFDVVPEGEAVNAFPEREQISPDGAFVRLIESRAAWLRALAWERLGRVREAGLETAGLGLIRDWLVLGPFEGESENESDVIYGLEELYESLSAERTYPGKDGPAAWRPFSSPDALGRVFPGSLFRSGGARNVYMLALVHSDDNQAAVLRFGADASAIVCVNHFQEARVRFGGLPDLDQEAFDVWLRKGWNVVLVRTASASDAWGLAVRLTLPDGRPFPGRMAIPTDGNRGEILAEAKKAAGRSLFERFYKPAEPASLGGMSVLAGWLDDHPDDSRASFYLASFLSAKRLLEGPRRFDREAIFRRAMELSGNDPFFCLMAARAVDPDIDGPNREENLRLVLLRAAADQGSAAAMTDMGRLYLDVMRQPRRADEYAERALAVNPMSPRAGVLDYDVAMAMGWRPVADRLLRNLAKRHPSAAAVRLRLGRAALADGRHRQASTEFHAILGLDAGNAEALDGAVMAMAMLGQTSAAVELLARHVGKFPCDSRARLRLAELYRILGRDAESLEVIGGALAMAPDDAAALAMRADIDRETYAEGRAEAEPGAWSPRTAQELDLAPPRRPPPDGWEYLYFQVEDRLAKNGAIDRAVSFAIRVHTARAARQLRHLDFWLDRDLENGSVTRLELIQPNGGREPLNPPGASGSSLEFRLPPLRTGVVIEARVEITRSRVRFLGDYFGQIATMAQDAPIRLSRYIFVSPGDRRLYFRAVNGAPEAMVVELPDGATTRVWEMNNVAAFKAEPFSPGRRQLAPGVQISAFDDWDEFARWYWRLIGGQYHTPPELRELARNLAGDAEFPMAKLDRAAEWVARNVGTRPWAFGPYAYRPINARAILARLSADGKDRTLFLCLLAREYGLTAWPVLARMRGRGGPSFGAGDLGLPLLDHFNHSLVMVESSLGGDVFLDASNPYRPPGVMPSRLSGSPGVAVLPGGAEMVRIPDLGVAACQWEETAGMVVDDDGSVLWEQAIDGAGTAAEALRARFAGPDGATPAWSGFLSALGADVGVAAAEFGERPEAPAHAAFSGRARLRRFAAVEGERVILSIPALPGASEGESGRFDFPLRLDEMVEDGVREQDLALPHGFRVARRIDVDYPEEWRLVNAPVSRKSAFSFGSLTLDATRTPGRLKLEFVWEVPGHAIAGSEFPEFRELAAEASRWLRPALVWERQ